MEYTFKYQALGQVSSVYLISIADSNNAFIKFSYWAEPTMTFTNLLLIIVGGIIFLSLLVFGSFLFLIDCTIKQSLEETVNSVRGTFT